MVKDMTNGHGLSCRHACRLVGLSRSVISRPTRADQAKVDEAVIEALNALVAQHGRWGFWKCHHRLRAEGHAWNHKRVYRIYCQMKLNLPRRTRKRIRTRQPQPLNAQPVLNDVWSLDFMRDTLYDGRPFRTLNVIDEGNREALRIECGTSITARRLVRVMNELIEVYGRPRAIRLDNGPEMTAESFVKWAQDEGIALWYIQPGKPNQNAYIERFNRSFRAEVLDAHLFDSVSAVQVLVDAWMSDYNDKRPHESLGNVPPTVFLPRVFQPPVSTFEWTT